MKYNFDELVQRRGTNSYKWDSAVNDEVLPMWVADMDFRTAQPIIEALVKRARHGVFGYTKVPESYFNAVTGWFERKHNFTFSKNWLLFTSGVVPALSAIIKAFTAPGDKVIVQTPVYNCFFSSIRNNMCETVANNLIYNDGKYSVDFDDLVRKTADPKAKLLLLCNPHNPVGRVWTKEELTRIGEICLQNDVLVVSDEIHCDLVYPGHTHIPFASLDEKHLYNSITCTSPSKTFNLAGLQVANILCADNDKRQRIDRALNINEVCEINAFAPEALIAAYNEGGEWLEQLKAYLYENYIYLKSFFESELPFLKVVPLEATYLVWVDFSAIGQTSETMAKNLLQEENLMLNAGTMYGSIADGFLRINIACPRKLLKEGLKKIKNLYEC